MAKASTAESIPPVECSLFLVSRISPTIRRLTVSSVSSSFAVSTISASSAPSAKRRLATKLPLAYHSGHRDKDAVEQRRFIVGMRGVLLVKILHELGHVELVGQADLTIRPVRHQVCHHALQTCHVSDPASVPSVAPSSLCLCHFCVSPI